MAESKSSIKFSCVSCDFVLDCQYLGRKPPFAKHIMLHEDCYVMKDPFSTEGGFISIGSKCSICKENVCMSTACSLFYTQRFCLKCAWEKQDEFPPELQKEVQKFSPESNW